MGHETFEAFDPHADYSVVRRRLPHWSQAGATCFITWRTADSMPHDVVKRWIAERNALLLQEGIRVDEAGLGTIIDCSRVSPKPETRKNVPQDNKQGTLNEIDLCGGESPKRERLDDRNCCSGFGETRLHWRRLVERLPARARSKVQGAFIEHFERHLDACHGECLLRRRALATIVAESLQSFDGDRYELADFVVMPNHVHLLVSFPDEQRMLTQCASWKRFTARMINEATGREGAFWQEDAYDHLVRSLEQFEHYRRYIAENGPRANLPPTDYLWWSKS